MKNPKITTFKIITPWWLRWTERFLRLEIKECSLKGKFKGQKFNGVMIDEVTYE